MNNKFNEQANASANPQAAIAILNYFDRISDRYSAGWLNNIEYDFWELLDNYNPENPPSYGGTYITPEEIQMLKRCSFECQGWWYWDDSIVEERFISLDEWLPIFGEWKQQKELKEQQKITFSSDSQPTGIIGKLLTRNQEKNSFDNCE